MYGTVSLPFSLPSTPYNPVPGSSVSSDFVWNNALDFRGWEQVASRLPDNNQNIIKAKDVRDPLWTLWNLVGYALDGSVVGPTGAIGSQGFQGVAGSQGNRGPQGNLGFQGALGFQGFQGFQGKLGFQGFQGF